MAARIATHNLCLHQRKIEIRLLNLISISIWSPRPAGVKTKDLITQFNVVNCIRPIYRSSQPRLLELDELYAWPLFFEIVL
jgi:hypothetical protein